MGDLTDRPALVLAWSSELDAAKALYGHIIGERLDSCDLCHPDNYRKLNIVANYVLARLFYIRQPRFDAQIGLMTFVDISKLLLAIEQMLKHIIWGLCRKLNAYGSDYKNNGLDFGAIEGLDSDGDGFINIDEITTLAFPGDAGDYPVGKKPGPG